MLSDHHTGTVGSYQTLHCYTALHYMAKQHLTLTEKELLVMETHQQIAAKLQLVL